MTLAELLAKEEDGTLLDIYEEIATGIVPATGYAHQYCRKVNKMIDAGELCINPTRYRRVYLPSLSKAVLREMAARYAANIVYGGQQHEF